MEESYFAPEAVSRYALAERWRTMAEAMIEDLDQLLEREDPRFLCDAAWKAREIATIVGMIEETQASSAPAFRDAE